MKRRVKPRFEAGDCAPDSRVWLEVNAGEVAVYPTRVMAPSSHSATG